MSAAAQGPLLYRCAVPKTRLTEAQCARNAARRAEAEKAGDKITAEDLFGACKGCQGVVWLAQQRGEEPEEYLGDRSTKKPGKRPQKSFRTIGSSAEYAKAKQSEAPPVIAESESVQPARAASAASCPPGWVTIPELARETGIARNTAAEALAARGFTVELHGGCLCCSREDADVWLTERAMRKQGISIAAMARRARVAPGTIRKALVKAGLMVSTILVAGERVLPADAAEKFLADYAGARSYNKSRGEQRWEEPAKPEPVLEPGRQPGLVTFKELADEEGVVPETIHARVAGVRREGLLKPVNPGVTPMLFRRVDIEAVMAKHRAVPCKPKNIEVEVPMVQAQAAARSTTKTGVTISVGGDLGAIWDQLTGQRAMRLLEREAIDGSIHELDEALAAVRTVARLAGFELPAEEASA